LVSNLTAKHTVQSLRITLQGSQSNRDGLGAIVKVHTTNSKTYTKVHDGVTGYLSHGVLPLYFGLGNTKATQVEVLWPSGVRQQVGTPNTQKLHIVEPQVVDD